MSFSLTVDRREVHRPAPVVLVVEDDFLLRRLAVDLVEDAGFNALEACGADEAIALLEARTDIGMLFTDVQMPGSMDGVELAHVVGRRWPAIKILVTSGRSRLSLSAMPTNSRFVAKPYDAEDLTAKLHSLTGLTTPSDAAWSGSF